MRFARFARHLAMLATAAVLPWLAPVGHASAAEILDGIKGADNRLVMPSNEYPWSAVGRVNTETGGHCTGVLVGPSLAVTAAHCLFDRRKMWFVPADQVHFVAGYKDGKYIAHTTAKDYMVPPDYREGAPPTGAIAVHDWAFIQLKDPIGDTAGWFGVANFDKRRLSVAIDDETRFVQAGYSRDDKRELTADIGCPVDGYAKGLDLVVHACDAVPGDSGSPIFFFDKGYPMLAAIHVATTRNKVPVRGIAVPAATFYPGIVELHAGQAGLPSKGDLMPRETAKMMLKDLGYNPTGGFSRAIGAFQSAKGVSPNGQLGYELVAQLIEAYGANHQ